MTRKDSPTGRSNGMVNVAQHQTEKVAQFQMLVSSILMRQAYHVIVLF